MKKKKTNLNTQTTKNPKILKFNNSLQPLKKKFQKPKNTFPPPLHPQLTLKSKKPHKILLSIKIKLLPQNHLPPKLIKIKNHQI